MKMTIVLIRNHRTTPLNMGWHALNVVLCHVNEDLVMSW